MDNLLLTVDLLKIYIAGGEAFRDAAFETIEAAFEQAEGEGAEDIYNQLVELEKHLRGE